MSCAAGRARRAYTGPWADAQGLRAVNVAALQAAAAGMQGAVAHAGSAPHCPTAPSPAALWMCWRGTWRRWGSRVRTAVCIAAPACASGSPRPQRLPPHRLAHILCPPARLHPPRSAVPVSRGAGRAGEPRQAAQRADGSLPGTHRRRRALPARHCRAALAGRAVSTWVAAAPPLLLWVMPCCCSCPCWPAAAAAAVERVPQCLPPGPRCRSSRLGSKVTLSKALDGSVIALAANYPWKSV